MWYNSCNNDAELLKDGGTLSLGFASYVTGSSGSAFAGGIGYAYWDNIAVSNIFLYWDNTAGSTIDLWFNGDHWSTQSGDSGFLGIADRYGNTVVAPDAWDSFYILSVRDGVLRCPYRNGGDANEAVTPLGPARLTDNTTYRLTVRQKDTAIEVYLNGVGYLTNSTSETFIFPQENHNGSGAGGGRRMEIGNRADPWFTGNLQAGEWVDEVAVYNGYYLPSELPQPGGALAFTDEPDSVTVLERASATFSNAFTGLGNIQWYLNSVPIDSATLPTYGIPSVPASMDGAQISVVVSNINHSITSSNAVLTVIPDTTKPWIVSAVCPSQIIVTFSEPVDPGSATTADNYQLAGPGGPGISGAFFGADASTVLLSTFAPLTEGAIYTLTVTNVADTAATPNVMTNTQVAFQYQSLAGYWRFEEGTGTTTADSSGYNDTGTIAGSPLPAWITPGKVGSGALDFGGGSAAGGGRVNIGNPAVLQLTGPITVSCWASPDTISGNGRAVTKGGGSGNRGWALGVESTTSVPPDGAWRFEIPIDSTYLTGVNSPVVAISTWTHVAGVYDPNDSGGPIIKIYTNGILAATSMDFVVVPMPDSGVGVGIGARYDGSVRWDGQLDEVRIHARALSDAEVAALTQPLQFLAPTVINSQLVLNWTGLGQLQSAPTVMGVYTNIVGATMPPYTNALAPENQFFRLKAR